MNTECMPKNFAHVFCKHLFFINSRALMIKWDSFMCFLFPGRGGTLSMASRTGCCPVTAGSGVMSQGWSTSLWVTSSCPLRTGSGRRTGTWMKTMEESPQRKRSVLRSLKPQKELSLALSCIWYSVCFQGWTYAIDFPATYTKDKKWNSCVRRRRWIRYRRFNAQDTWVKVCTSTKVLKAIIQYILS